MVTNKYITRIASVIMAAAVILCLMASLFSDKLQEVYGNNAVTMKYESKLFSTDQIMDIDILMDEDDWNDMLENAISEEYYSCDVVVNGKTFYSVGIRPKGNTSLSSIVNDPDTDRYSFKLEFDHYIEGQTCYGLDKLILNNNYADATNMKEAIVYDMYQYLGVDGKDGDGWQMGEKPDGEDFPQKGEMPDGADFPQKGEMPDGEDFPQKGEMPDGADFPQKDEMPDGEDFPQMGEAPNGEAADIKMGIMGGNGGSDLNYTDDDLDSYSTIWDGEITDTDKKDHKRVVEALKNISEGTDLETYMDVDNILKYMAVHTFVVNDDSLSGTMAHNYYLYEYNGKLNILPWDYNLSFGGMSMGGKMGGQSLGATSVINDAIDTPFSITDFFNALLENEEYLEQYHGYLNELVEKYVNGGEFEKTYERIRSQIDDLVGNDPTAFYSYEEYEEAANMLIEVVQLRAKSVSGQLAGTIPSTDEGQQQDSSNLIDGSDIDLSVMGSFSGGGGGNEGQGKDNGFAGTPQPFDAGDVSPISEEKADLQDSNQDSVK
ncbi:CotH kinase family protein [Blautia acetigignens]|uniref:CotH kinase family protein n=1 Tax=Blautia acetigignens TaxID=2981783 RepID=A0ABV1CJE2_9FIRM